MAERVILLAEDDPALRQLLSFTLQRDFVVLTASNAEEALQIFEAYKNIDLILTDVQLGDGIDGISLAERMLTERAEIRALLISGFAEAAERAAEKGLPFLSKPFVPETLLERVRGVLETKLPPHAEAVPKQQRMTG